MIGDWVHIYKENICYDADCRITGIEEKYIWYGSEYFSIEDVQPIPLTPEILEKNGFTNEGYFAKLVVEEYVVICDCSNVAVLQNDEMKMDIPIKYVHELQHALRLCGIDKDITLD